MSTRRALPVLLASLYAFLFFGLGNCLGARQNADSDWQFDALRAEIAQLKRKANETAGTAGTPAAALNADALSADATRAAMVADIKRQLQDEMGLLPLNLLRERSASFVEL